MTVYGYARVSTEGQSLTAQVAIARRDAGKTLMDIARSYNVSYSTMIRL